MYAWMGSYPAVVTRLHTYVPDHPAKVIEEGFFQSTVYTSYMSDKLKWHCFIGIFIRTLKRRIKQEYQVAELRNKNTGIMIDRTNSCSGIMTWKTLILTKRWWEHFKSLNCLQTVKDGSTFGKLANINRHSHGSASLPGHWRYRVIFLRQWTTKSLWLSWLERQSHIVEYEQLSNNWISGSREFDPH